MIRIEIDYTTTNKHGERSCVFPGYYLINTNKFDDAMKILDYYLSERHPHGYEIITVRDCRKTNYVPVSVYISAYEEWTIKPITCQFRRRNK